MPGPGTLFTQVQAGPADLAVQAALAGSAFLYLAAVRRRARRRPGRGRPWPLLRTAAFLGGIAVLWVAVGSGLAAYDDTRVEVHVVEHLMLMMLAPPLLVIGQPLLLMPQVLRRGAQVRVVRLVQGRVGRTLGNPVLTWLVYLVPMAVCLTDASVYRYLVAHPAAHAASHLFFVGAGFLYWEPLVGSATFRLSPPARVISVLANMPFEVLVGIGLLYRNAPVGSAGTLADTRAGGEAFVVGATLLSTVWLAVLVGQWALAAARQERRSRSRPATLEWTTPWWVTEPGAAHAPGRSCGPTG